MTGFGRAASHREHLQLDDWLREAAPSAALRRWFDHDPAKWEAFKDRYFRELDQRTSAVHVILAKLRAGTVTLVFGAKDMHYNNAVALKEYLERHAEK